MAADPKPPEDNNVVSLKEIRAKAAAPPPKQEKQMPVLLIFLGLLAVLVVYKMLLS